MANIQIASQEWVSGFTVSANTAYKSNIINSPTGNLYLENLTETYIGTITNANAITIVLPTPINGFVNESILIFKIGASLPTITQPAIIYWRGIMPILVINSTWTIAYEQVNTGSGYEIYSVATKNV